MHFLPPAYLDPGSGSFIIQILVAALLGVGVALRAYWGKIIKFFGRKKTQEDASDEDDPQ